MKKIVSTLSLVLLFVAAHAQKTKLTGEFDFDFVYSLLGKTTQEAQALVAGKNLVFDKDSHKTYPDGTYYNHFSKKHNENYFLFVVKNNKVVYVSVENEGYDKLTSSEDTNLNIYESDIEKMVNKLKAKGFTRIKDSDNEQKFESKEKNVVALLNIDDDGTFYVLEIGAPAYFDK